jgi:hypothetical protein
LQAKEKNSLVLDDVLWATVDIRKQFTLPKPHFGLKQIERVAGARKALGEIIEATKRKWGPEICSKRHALLKDLGRSVYAEEVKGRAFSGYWRLSPSHVDRALRRVFEIALQTLFQLPARDPKVQRAQDKLVSLASQFRKLAERVYPVVQTDERVGVYFSRTESGERLRLLALPAELRWAAEMLNAVSSDKRIVRLRMDSPNPQVRFALYLVGWIEVCTGRKHYKHLQTLAAAALAAADEHREHPKWLDRLEIEMTRKMNKRRWRERLRALRKVRVLPY